MKGELINMTRAWDKQKIWVSNRNQTHDPEESVCHGFDSYQGLRFFFFVPRLWHVDQFTYHISLPSLKFTIFIHFIHIKYTRINSPYLSLKICYKTAAIKNFITSIFGSRVLDWIVPHGCTTAQPTSRNVISCILRAFACWSIPWINPWVIYNQQSIDTSIDTLLLCVGVFNVQS